MIGYKNLTCKVSVRDLTAQVQYAQAEKRERVTITHVIIKRGGDVLGKATLGGRWSQQQAIGEFRRFPKKFGFHKAIPEPDTLVSIHLGPLVVAVQVVLGIVNADEGFALFDAAPDTFASSEGMVAAKALGLVLACAA